MKLFPDYSGIFIQQLSSAWLSSQKVEVAMLRLDRLHPEISGNKWFKLKHNLKAARQQGKGTILTFGGSWSNHIAATAAVCDIFGFKSIGIIRGEEPPQWSHTLLRAKEHGMELHFISREQYRKKTDPIFIKQLITKHKYPYVIPEGGNNEYGIKGCKEILTLYNTNLFTHICCPVGTGTTLGGLINSAGTQQQILGFAALKDACYLQTSIDNCLQKGVLHPSWALTTAYHFGGFAKKTESLVNFMKDFLTLHDILLDFVYTAKMMYGMMNLIKKGYFKPGSRILAIHTGGLQGNNSLDRQLGLNY